eukprot:5825709-Pleurochrysis_carterae.AAC.3
MGVMKVARRGKGAVAVQLAKSAIVMLDRNTEQIGEPAYSGWLREYAGRNVRAGEMRDVKNGRQRRKARSGE